MKILIVYYSRTNVTKMIAEKLQKELKCDIEEISDNGNYNGKLGYLKGGMTASMSRTSSRHIFTRASILCKKESPGKLLQSSLFSLPLRVSAIFTEQPYQSDTQHHNHAETSD